MPIMDNTVICEEHILPNGEIVEFHPETHTYYVNKKELPSVTTIIGAIYGSSYSAVKPDVLKRAAKYGTDVHEELEHLINIRKEIPDFHIESDFQEVTNYFNFVEPVYKIDPILTEKVVVLYDENNSPCAAGRFDLLCYAKGKKTLADFKTTSTILRPQVTGQLNTYLLACRQSGYLTKDEECELGVIHLSGEKSRFLPIPCLGEAFYKKVYEASEKIQLANLEI